eukprot:TRINITY_DN25524_c0_g1_i1.p1 TRINITY_DN25524_c0_g1~~TRINITY_DN25524_c0_g1_i1.p1  ORF type:complete len:626 (-),score=80.38 TRINITY_DN25524_c0_g1_i1:58-1935(-)
MNMWLALFLALVYSFCVVDVSCVPCEGADECEDPASLLQARRGSRRDVGGHKQICSKALTFEGGGLSSVAAQSAFVSNLIAAKSTSIGLSKANLQKSGLLDDFDCLASVGGGGWFTSSLLYSKSFLILVNQMSRDLARAGMRFQKKYLAPWFEQAHEHSEVDWAQFDDAFQILSGFKMVESVFWGQTILNQAGWSGYISLLLRHTTKGDITSSTKLVDVLPWAAGKTWLACHSVPTPQEEGAYKSALLYAKKRHIAGDNETGVDGPDSDEYRYSVLTGLKAALPSFIPARFSVKFGKPVRSAPASYTGVKIPKGAKGVWKATQGYETIATDTSQAYGPFQTLLDPRVLPLNNVVASASAALGGAVYSRFSRDVLEHAFLEIANVSAANLGSKASVWVSTSSSESSCPFLAAQNIVSPILTTNYRNTTSEGNSKLASNEIHPLVDGMYTDSCGIGNAVSVGASSVTAFCSLSSGFLNLFGTGSSSTYSLGFVPSGNVDGMPFQQFPIFDFEDNAYGGFSSAREYAAFLVDQFARISDDDTALSSRVTIGTLNVITLDNPWLGVQRNKKVTLNIINGAADMLSSEEDFKSLATVFAALKTVVDDITSALGEPSKGLINLKNFFSIAT